MNEYRRDYFLASQSCYKATVYSFADLPNRATVRAKRVKGKSQMYIT